MIKATKDFGATIGTKHTFNDFGLILTKKEISAPVVQTKYVDVPGRNGAVDMTEVVTGNVRYNNRTITMEFVTDRTAADWAIFQSNLESYMQGQKMRIVFDDDVAFYWLGRIDVSLEPNGYYATVKMTADVEPYKYSIATSEDDWLWDPFDFEQSIVNEGSDIEVSGSTTYTLTCYQRWENPIIISDTAGITVTFEGITKTLAQGSQVMYEVVLTEGENVFTFSGNGTVSIVYVGGRL